MIYTYSRSRKLGGASLVQLWYNYHTGKNVHQLRALRENQNERT